MTPALLDLAAVLLVGGFGVCLLALLKRDAVRRLVVLEMATPVVVLVLLLLAEGYARPAYLDVGLVLAVVSFAGSLVYARFLERWL